ncbi:phosphoserine phosphatase SerB [Rhodovibrionaceae bacterium A322]
MTQVLTLLTDPAQAGLTEAHVDQAARCLERTGAEIGTSTWLESGVACDLTYEGLSPEAVLVALRPAFEDQPIDLGPQSAEGRRKKLLLADMESTIIGQEMLDELADAVGLRDKIADITSRAMRGELDFEASLKERVAMLKGLSKTTLEDSSARMALNPGARQLVQTMIANGATAALVSGGFTFYTEKIAAICGFHYHQANRLLEADGQLTGEVGLPILGREAKLEALEGYCSELSLNLSQTATVGDGANDLSMLRAAGLGVAYHAKPLVRAAAPFRLDHANLTGLLYLQGFTREEFVGE